MAFSIVFFNTVIFCSISNAGETVPLQGFLFASEGCERCHYIKTEVLPKVLEQYPDKVTFIYKSTDDLDNYRLFLEYENHYNEHTNDLLKLFIGNSCLVGEDGIEENLETAIETALGNNITTPVLSLDNKKTTQADDTSQLEKKISWGVIITAGLTDGINPCAFATVIFFVSLLASLRKKTRDIILIGLLFSLTVFLTYFAIGFGLFKSIKAISVNTGIAKWIEITAGIWALGCAIFCFVDYFRYKRKGGEAMLLKLPEPIRARIHKITSTKMRTGNIIAGTITTGIVVTILESACTGQVYAPVIALLSSDQISIYSALSRLSVYNIMFILPLIAILFLNIAGIKATRIASFHKKYAGLSKLIMGILFLALGLIVII